MGGGRQRSWLAHVCASLNGAEKCWGSMHSQGLKGSCVTDGLIL